MGGGFAKMKEDLYAILGVPHEADESEIRSAHRALVKKYHPDAGEGSSDERFRAIQNAYDVLSAADSRAEYDRSLREQAQSLERSAPYYRRYSGRFAPFAAHVDLRHLSRGGRTERIDFGLQARFARSEADPWDDLLAFLFGDPY
jgi:curved DNA-binding protein CbpA